MLVRIVYEHWELQYHLFRTTVLCIQFFSFSFIFQVCLSLSSLLTLNISHVLIVDILFL